MQARTPDVDVEVVVIGAGVVGLAVAAELVESGASVVVVERNAGPGRETSSRNSEVIHAGIYYPTGSLKARLCVEGNELLYAFCDRAGVACRRIGKLVVACAEEEVSELERLFAVGDANGVQELRLVDQQEIRRWEPEVSGVAALYSPSTGIVDSHGLVKALEGRARAGGVVLYQAAVRGIEPAREGYRIRVENPGGTEWLLSRLVVNAAGLEADRVASLAGIGGYRLWWCKGEYFSLSGPVARGVSRLIYPVPARGLTSLGVHVTLDLAGRVRLGPDATYVDRTAASLDVDPRKAAAFYDAARRFLPGVRLEDLRPDTAGIRPKLQGPAEPWADFIIRDEVLAGCPGFVNLVGLESPGLTSCLSVAREVCHLLASYA
jgi:L-2-hydroxyglutarate oxidase LhgO